MKVKPDKLNIKCNLVPMLKILNLKNYSGQAYWMLY